MGTPELAKKFAMLSDEELKRRAYSGGLTAEAQIIANAELSARGMALPSLVPDEDIEPAEYHGDMTIVARQLTATEAHLLCSCLNVAGIPAVTGDVNFVQANELLSFAVGGACIRVPKAFVNEAIEVIAAFKRGEFTLDDDYDGDEFNPDQR